MNTFCHVSDIDLCIQTPIKARRVQALVHRSSHIINIIIIKTLLFGFQRGVAFLVQNCNNPITLKIKLSLFKIRGVELVVEDKIVIHLNY